MLRQIPVPGSLSVPVEIEDEGRGGLHKGVSLSHDKKILQDTPRRD
ncbi:MAG: hypothetical protein WC362_09455 [Methanoregula sp.]